ncbi:MAG: 4-hydroxy-tetrahydrodipicolinate reductase [Ruminococcaceae bacterium]|nr:4-hydroxy-tetrahydrodipicolinate reductase [Oscillospiraceae bacterium]
MINVIINGANGKMGKTVASMLATMPDFSVCAGVDVYTEQYGDFPIVEKPRLIPTVGDVIIDFSNPAALLDLLPYAMEKKIPVVVCTTGLGNEHKSLLEAAAREIPVFFSANMSLGISLLTELVKKATAVLGEGYDIEIIEKHHNRKLDAPSGTAMAIADAISEVATKEYVYDRHSVRRPRGKQELGIHAVRGGTIVGEHTVLFAGQDEVIEVKHSAGSRDIFAVGAIRAAAFLLDKPAGMYAMRDLVAAAE